MLQSCPIPPTEFAACPAYNRKLTSVPTVSVPASTIFPPSQSTSTDAASVVKPSAE